MEELCLEFCPQVTAAAFEQLTDLKALRRLDLHEAGPRDDEELRSLRNVRALEQLVLAGAPVEGYGLRHLAALPALRSLNVGSSEVVTDDGLAAIQGLSRLESLELQYTDVGDAGVAHLRGHPSLRDLSLEGTAISDRSLDVLATVPQLRTLEIGGTYCTPDGIAQFRATRPECSISEVDEFKDPKELEG